MSQDGSGTRVEAGGPDAVAPADLLADLDDLPVSEHVARFEAVHDTLRARLAGEPADGGAA
ncbi:hypothetical protein [Xylanimonas ulmi]|uniref:Uncharacterized protein n=1 Tax=Xylanimonas ulmi TaxID=228973 RepID=A0A4Q7M304_9MICO|nr:hypothetical protein [Xylanibacterium ulmi]RZS61237.1 hypothetical protein EV386_1528 [Xylanibacterium ulmi]